MTAMKRPPEAESDSESTLIQLMNKILEKQQQQSFLSKLVDNVPGVIIAALVAAFSFYVVVQVDLAMIKEKCVQVQGDLSRLEKFLEKEEGRVNELDKRIQQCERQTAIRNNDR